jgi:LysR family transcriptional activator of glutamate synthase operon
MDTNDLRRFLVVCSTSHVTEAADILRLPQSTVSRSVLRLEEELNTPLFDRIGRRIQLNSAGETLREHASRVLQEVDAAASALAGVRDPSRGTVEFGYLHSLGNWLVPELLRTFHEERPLVHFALTDGRQEALTEALRERRLHLALTSPRPTDRALAWEVVHSERLCVTVAESHPLARRKSVSLADIQNEQILLPRFSTSIRDAILRLAEQAGVELNLTLRSDRVTTLNSLVYAGYGLTISARPRGHRTTWDVRGLRDVPLTEAGATRDVGVTWHRQAALPAVAEAFIAHCLAWKRDVVRTNP